MLYPRPDFVFNPQEAKKDLETLDADTEFFKKYQARKKDVMIWLNPQWAKLWCDEMEARKKKDDLLERLRIADEELISVRSSRWAFEERM